MACKLLSAVLVTLLLATNAWHLYARLDDGVTRAYREQLLHQLANNLQAASKVCSTAVRGKPEAEVLALAKRLFPGQTPFVKDGAVHTTWLSVSLNAKGNATSCVVDESVAQWAELQLERP